MCIYPIRTLLTSKAWCGCWRKHFISWRTQQSVIQAKQLWVRLYWWNSAILWFNESHWLLPVTYVWFAYVSSLSFPADDSPVVNRQVKEADCETGLSTEAAEVVRSTMERVLATWESYKDCLYLLQVWLGQEGQSQAQEKEVQHLPFKNKTTTYNVYSGLQKYLDT